MQGGRDGWRRFDKRGGETGIHNTPGSVPKRGGTIRERGTEVTNRKKTRMGSRSLLRLDDLSETTDGIVRHSLVVMTVRRSPRSSAIL